MSEKLVDNFKILDDLILEYKQKYENFFRPISYKVGINIALLNVHVPRQRNYNLFNAPTMLISQDK